MGDAEDPDEAPEALQEVSEEGGAAPGGTAERLEPPSPSKPANELTNCLERKASTATLTATS